MSSVNNFLNNFLDKYERYENKKDSIVLASSNRFETCTV